MKFNLVSQDKPIIIVKAEVNGEGPFDFAVDTGASVTVLSNWLAQKLEMSENPGTQKKGHACCGEVDMALSSVKSVKLGDVEARDLQVALMDLSSISEAMKIDLAGIIGYSFMKDYRVIVDYPNRDILFQKP